MLSNHWYGKGCGIRLWYRTGNTQKRKVQKVIQLVEYTTSNLIPGDKPGKNSGKLEYSLPNVGGITHLELLLKATNGSSGNTNNSILNTITGIRIEVHNNRYAFTMSGTEAYKLAALRDREATEISESDTANAAQYVRIPILLGRTKDDQLYGLDLGKCEDPKLIIEFDLTKVRACGATGFVSGSFTVDIDITITQNLAQPAYVGLISGAEIIPQRPTGIRRTTEEIHTLGRCIGLYLYAYKSGIADGDLVRNVKLSAPTELSTLVDRSFTDLQQARKLLTGYVVTSWAPIWIDPNRLSNQPPKPLNGDKAYLEMEELVADGAEALIGEFVERQ